MKSTESNGAAPDWGVNKRERLSFAPVTSASEIGGAVSREFHQASRFPRANVRPRVHGKFIFLGDEKLYVRGVTYGTFRPGDDGSQFPCQEAVDRDFAQMAANGVNAVRTYTLPPVWLLDAAARHGLWVMVGTSWPQEIAFLDDDKAVRLAEDRVREGMRACAGHPALLCYAIGNEIPASIVRWHGPRRVERFLERLYRIAKAEDPEGIVAYVNYPSTEYLQLPFVDLICFNVYLEAQDRLQAYLARLHNIVGERPVIIAEMGLDSRRNDQDTQAWAVDWQIRASFAAGCAGVFVFAWTDEWYRGGADIEDWDFGLTSRDRQPKPALAAARKAFSEAPFSTHIPWPRISVVVCSHNGASTIRDCLEGLRKLVYPNFEVIVVDDGSADATAAIAAEYDLHLISTPNRGLGEARNTGMRAASGEIVAYIDDDAHPDSHWLIYQAATFMAREYAGVGGPNFAPPGDGLIADCVANSPGGPVNVLISDEEAEHIAGCNMAFRKSSLEMVGGFDPQFRAAGDDVDICWRFQQHGLKLGFTPAAVVWHHRRNSLRAFWRQQRGYGQAEALLEKKWPEKFNAVGHFSWVGRMYGRCLTRPIGLRPARIYHSVWGTGLFQSLYQPAPSIIGLLVMMPEWYMIIAALGALSLIGILWSQLLFVLPVFTLAIGALLLQVAQGATRASFADLSGAAPSGRRIARLKRYGLTAFLHLLQPLARLSGRLQQGLTPCRRCRGPRLSLRMRKTWAIWSEHWQSTEDRVRSVEAALQREGVVVNRGGECDRWDLEVRGGLMGATRMLMAIEEPGAGRQLVRFRWWPKCSPQALVLTLLISLFSVAAALDQAWGAATILGIVAASLATRMYQECTAGAAVFEHILQKLEGSKVG
ncbi:MAG: glycosyltransferase [Chloroflexi bacterium]|nr:glycosyltransferase [Chloroflexota bacterium]